MEMTPVVNMARPEKRRHDRNFRPWGQFTDRAFRLGEEEELIVLHAPLSRQPATAEEKPFVERLCI